MWFRYRGWWQFKIDGPMSCLWPCWLDPYHHPAHSPHYRGSYFGRQQDHFLLLMVENHPDCLHGLHGRTPFSVDKTRHPHPFSTSRFGAQTLGSTTSRRFSSLLQHSRWWCRWGRLSRDQTHGTQPTQSSCFLYQQWAFTSVLIKHGWWNRFMCLVGPKQNIWRFSSECRCQAATAAPQAHGSIPRFWFTKTPNLLGGGSVDLAGFHLVAWHAWEVGRSDWGE